MRRPGDRLADSGRRWAYADSRPGREGLWWSVRTTDADLLTAPWDGSVGEPAPGPTYLVCTHGGHDACCALRGRPLARALPTPGPADVWECSHLGGDRFAANVLVLPHGFYYGQVPGDGADLVAAHTRGRWPFPGSGDVQGSPARTGRPARRPRGTGALRPRRPAGGLHHAADAAGLGDRTLGRGPGRSGRGRRHRGGEPPVGPGRPPHLPGHPPGALAHLARDAPGRLSSRRHPSARPRAVSSGMASSVGVSEPW
ncbi:sucrase ferredoxin [Blastococcus brunescens]|uniref:Sucrase ferredoxin n=1 Tax=Blastococcus brunescens TaxID=1564165 RepID=A0ABZ1BA50_9ACTN|nr:sucrase ferredoxin [Blastococcus sp. BMG 8361]WRL66938.1 sucrase ferredoxin [Blastococcus sp. BMG 8361]